MQITEKTVPGYELVAFGQDREAGYRGIIAIHSTVLGPAAGGTRFWNYGTEEDALQDALRLSRGMTYKSALAGLPCGGGKSIILGDNRTREREKIFRAHGRFVHALGGKYITAEDVGTSPADMEFVLQETTYVAGLQGRSGDPSPRTARGVFRAMQAAARHRWGRDSLAGRTIALQGCGNVGSHLAAELHRAGAKLVVTDVDEDRVARVVRECGALAVAQEEIYGVQADIFAPCALGAILNDHTIPRLRVEIVCGGANNQLLETRHGDLLEQRGILYVPDYAANAGGIISGGCMEMLGWEEARMLERVEAIYDCLLEIFKIAHERRLATWRAADILAEQRLRPASLTRTM
ncbi:MAG TPA: Glu/Leu/Phe/Val dehydrogenase [Candidatus Saccharimonadales bacterium]|jgi:leucine dehydrogenase|nr:Glu/Leu/Phe/Val dehydrogenase [Candidatus Saccharimonadales bacterium]